MTVPLEIEIFCTTVAADHVVRVDRQGFSHGSGAGWRQKVYSEVATGGVEAAMMA
jgi:hypothetical protein